MRVIHYYSRYFTHPSGVVDSIGHWVQQTRRSTNEVFIWAAKPSSISSGGPPHQDHTETIRHLGKRRETWIPVALIWKLRRYDVLYLHEGWTASNLFAAFVGRLRKATVILMPHGVYEYGITSKIADVAGMRRRLERLTLRLTHFVHIFYEAEAQVVTAFAKQPLAFIVFANGAPTASEGRPWTSGGSYFLWMGRFDVDHKGIDNLIRFWSRLELPRPRLVLAGPDHRGGRQQMITLAQSLGVSQDIEFHRHVAGAAKADLMLGCRAYLHPSRWESCSITLLEFLALGAPTLISNTIHAANDLGSIGVTAVTDFSCLDPSNTSQALHGVDNNVDLGNHARAWVQDAGSWDHIGVNYARWLDTKVRGSV